jgi:sugar/nucleoside kinase (ribokinase family)
LRIGIASHIVLDKLAGFDGEATESVGGPPCYSGITCRRFGFDVSLATKVGRDFPAEARRLLDNEKILLQERQFVEAPTTRFSISYDNGSRRLNLQARCAPLSASDIEYMKVDCWLVSPVYDEVPRELLKGIKAHRGLKDFVMLDPQGYMRHADGSGNISIQEKIDLDVSGIRAVKVDPQEMSALTRGLAGIEGMLALQARGVEFVVSTVPNEIHLLYEKTHYWAKLDEIVAADSTGAGDILSAAFACAYLKEKDPLWALCFGAGAVRAALETRKKGLDKIPSYSRIEEGASYFYNTVGFKQLS